MNSQNDQEKLGQEDQGLGEVFVPAQVVKNFNQMVAEPHPLPSDRSVKPPSENNAQNQAPLLTDKQQAQPLIKKPDQAADESKQQPRPMQGSAHHSQDDISVKSSGGGTKSPHHSCIAKLNYYV